MSKARTSSICFFCEFGLTPRRRPQQTRQSQQVRDASTSSYRSPRTVQKDDRHTSASAVTNDVALSPEQLRNQVYLKSSSDVWRRSFFGPDTVMRGRAINHRVTAFVGRLRNDNMSDYTRLQDTRRNRRGSLGDPSADHSRAETGRNEAPEERPQDQNSRRHETNDRGQSGPNTFPDFIRMSTAGATISSPAVTQQLLRYQFRSCGSPEDFIRVFSVLLDTRPGMPNHDGKGARLLANENIQHILSSNLARYDPQRALYALSLLIQRLESYGQSADASVLRLAILSALQSHSLTAARRYLQTYSARETIGSNFFSQIMSAMRTGLLSTPEDQRNTRGVLDLMYRPSNEDANAAKFHLEPVLEQHLNPAQVRDWVYILGSCSATPHIRDEWIKLQDLFSDTSSSSIDAEENGKLLKQAPRFFMRAFFAAGSPADAWKIFETHGDRINMSDETIWTLLMENAEEKPDLPEPLQKTLEEKIKQKLERMLKDIETRMGIKWVAGEDGQDGRHDVAASHVSSEADNVEGEELVDVPDLGQDLKAFTRFAMERQDEILAQKDDILAGKDPRPYQEPFS